MRLYKYRVYDQKDGTCRVLGSLKEVSSVVGRSPSTVMNRVLENRLVNGWRVQKFYEEGGRTIVENDGDPVVETKSNRYLSEYGIIGFDSEGVRHWYKNVEAASFESKVPRLHVRECLKEGCGYEGWTFDYALDKEICI